MEAFKDEKYWIDYTDFINEAEKITGLSPANLISRYKELIEELNDVDKEYYLEWQYELDNDIWIRQKIQVIFDHKPISENELLKNFKLQIAKLDIEMKKHIFNHNQTSWWNDPKFKFSLE